jgi:uncharacterized membrane protein YedE/YeeE
MELLVVLAGLLAGAAFGGTVQRTNFCTMGAISDIVLFADWRRMRAWLLAIAIALLATQALAVLGMVDLHRSAYLDTAPVWPAVVLGGLLFGFGMTQTGGCVSKNLVRLGGGNLKSLVVLAVFAVVALLTTLIVTSPEATPALPQASGASAVARVTTAILAGGALLLFCLKDGGFRRSRRDLGAGLVLGALVAVLWLVPALGATAQPALLNFVAPVSEAARGLVDAATGGLGFGVAAMIGAVAGAFVAARASGTFRTERFACRDDVFRHLVGAALMGAGGALAMGCTIGHGITGLSTLAGPSILAFFALIAGGLAGVRYLEHGSVRGLLRALFAGS